MGRIVIERPGGAYITGHRIMADAERGKAASERPDGMPVRPLALRKQQVQLGGISALRL
jgi:lipopolysaccharide export system protein LptA